LQALESYDLAISDYLACLEIRKSDYAALLNLGIAYFKQRKFVHSLTALQNAQSIQFQDPTLHYYKGNVLRQMGQCIDAITCYFRAIEIKPNDARYFIDLGNTQLDIGRISEAIQSYGKALELEPSYPYLFGHLVHVKCQVADWNTLAADLNAIRIGIEAGQKVTAPFPLLALVDSSDLAKKASEIYCKDQRQVNEESIHMSSKTIDAQMKRKLKIAYFSSDFYRHATAYLMAQLFESHDRSQFETIGFSFSVAPRDEMSDRIEVAFDQYFDVSGLSRRS
jgi:predicted O-linked N-acetylglucosamine transferase (SPINDLY family)